MMTINDAQVDFGSSCCDLPVNQAFAVPSRFSLSSVSSTLHYASKMDDVHGNISHAMRDNYNEYGVEEVRIVCMRKR